MMYFQIKELTNILDNYKKIIIYGTGIYGREICSVLFKLNLKDKIQFFVVTKRKEVFLFEDKVVKEICEVGLESEDTIILVAVNETIQNEIVKTLKKYNYQNYILLSNYVLKPYTDLELEMISRTHDFPNFANYMADVLANTRLLEMKEKNHDEIVQMILQKRNKEKNKRKEIVVIAAMLHTRHYAIFKAILSKGIRIILLDYENEGRKKRPHLKDDIANLNLIYIECASMTDALYLALDYNSEFYYVIPMWSNASIANIMIRYKNVFGKVVLELVDVMNGSYNIDDRLLDIERFAIENADGVIWRYFAKEYLEDHFQFNIKGKSLQFIDCCIGKNKSDKIPDDGVLKICFAGGACEGLVRNNPAFQKRENGYLYFLTAEEVLQPIKQRKDVIFHAYIGNATKEEKEYLNSLEKKYDNFHVFYEVPYSDMNNILSKYDYGLVQTSGRLLLSEEEYKKERHIYNTGAYIVSMAQKYFDYIDAGLAVIATKPQFLCDYLEKLGVLIRMDGDKLDIDYLKENKCQFRKNAERAREILSIDQNIDRLLDFFEQI